jgi:hypothetical protein
MNKSIEAHGRTYHTGRLRPTTRPRFMFGNYVERLVLPVPTLPVDWTKAATTSLANVYLNDQLGDCVIAGYYHVKGVLSGNAGSLFDATTAQVTADYSAIGGYVPGRPGTDQGCDEQTALGYWTSTGDQGGTKLLGWLGVDATNTLLLQQAVWLFENLYFGVELPDKWVNPMPQTSGFVWDVAGRPDPGYGHCIAGLGATTQGIQVATWGMIGTVTYAALAEYMIQNAGGECYVLVSPDQIAKAKTKAPNGFDWPTLIADFNSLGGHLPIPAPTPVPVPPVPGPTPGAGGYTINLTLSGTITPS